MKLELVPFTPVTFVDSVTCTLKAIPAAMNVSYLIKGDLGQICWPDDVQSSDNFWEHTCFEFFIASMDNERYYEFNQSSSGAWACYEFSRYRTDMTVSETIVTNNFLLSLDENTCQVDLEVAFPHTDDFQLGLSVVLEDQNAKLHYFSLSHPMEKPDFHAREHFAPVNKATLLQELP